MNRALKIKDVIPLLLLGAIAVTAWLMLRPLYALAGDWFWIHWLRLNVYDSWSEEMRNIALSPFFYGATLLILAGEWIYPVNPKQKLIGVGFGQDVGWLLLDPLVRLTVMDTSMRIGEGIYHSRFEFLTIDSIRLLPYPVRFAIAVIAGDFVAWVSHWLQHHVPLFWRFHAVHHAQRELNLFTDLRFHFIDRVVGTTVKLFPFLMFVEDPGGIVIYGLWHTWYTRLYHANIRSNYGFLRYFMITPQSHRVHHSIDPRHRDLNLGAVFCIWDRLFHTYYKREDEYPATGIDDNDFPLEQTGSVRELVSLLFQQHWYPFKKAILGLKAS